MQNIIQTGFQSLIYASATLLGLVLIALVFAYQSAITRIQNLLEFRHLAKWVFAAGFSCFIYFSCCMLVGFRISENETSRAALIIITAVATLILLVTHYLELKWAAEMAREDPKELRNLCRVQVALVLLTFIVFESLAWLALLNSSLAELEKITYQAFSYALIMASLRAVVLVASSFWAVMVISHISNHGGNPGPPDS